MAGYGFLVVLGVMHSLYESETFVIRDLSTYNTYEDLGCSMMFSPAELHSRDRDRTSMIYLHGRRKDPSFYSPRDTVGSPTITSGDGIVFPHPPTTRRFAIV